jgi:hypothetical protein
MGRFAPFSRKGRKGQRPQRREEKNVAQSKGEKEKTKIVNRES